MNNIQISQLTFRKVIGFLALSFPFLLYLGTLTGGMMPILMSLSSAYWSNVNALFIGILVAFGIFLITYKGYDKTDEIITTIAGVAMMGVVFFPTFGGTSYLFLFISSEINALLHVIFAAIAFGSLGIMSFFQFTKHQGEITKNKKKRNLIYRTCGLIIFASILLMFPAKIITIADNIRLFFWLESIVVVAFGVSWLVKGEALLKD